MKKIKKKKIGSHCSESKHSWNTQSHATCPSMFPRSPQLDAPLFPASPELNNDDWWLDGLDKEPDGATTDHRPDLTQCGAFCGALQDPFFSGMPSATATPLTEDEIRAERQSDTAHDTTMGLPKGGETDISDQVNTSFNNPFGLSDDDLERILADTTTGLNKRHNKLNVDCHNPPFRITNCAGQVVSIGGVGAGRYGFACLDCKTKWSQRMVPTGQDPDIGTCDKRFFDSDVGRKMSNGRTCYICSKCLRPKKTQCICKNPSRIQKQPPFGQQQPPFGQQQPPFGLQQPPFGQQQPPFGLPPMLAENGDFGMSADSLATFATADFLPEVDAFLPAADAPLPAADAPLPAADAPLPAAGAPLPAAGAPLPTSSGCTNDKSVLTATQAEVMNNGDETDVELNGLDTVEYETLSSTPMDQKTSLANLRKKFMVYKTQARKKIDEATLRAKDLQKKLDTTIKENDSLSIHLATERKVMKETLQDKEIELLRLDTTKLNSEKELALSKQENAKNQRCIDAQKKLIEDLQADLKEYREAEWKEKPAEPAPTTPVHETELNKQTDESEGITSLSTPVPETELNNQTDKSEGIAPLSAPVQETELNTKTDESEGIASLFAPLPAQIERPPKTTKDAIRAVASNKRKLKQAFHCRCAKPATVTCAEKGCERGHCGKPFCAGFKDAKAMKKQPWVCNYHSEICEVRCAFIKENGRTCDKILDDRNHEYVINAVACSCQGCIKGEDAKCTKSWSCWECADYDGEADHFIFPGHVCKKKKKSRIV